MRRFHQQAFVQIRQVASGSIHSEARNLCSEYSIDFVGNFGSSRSCGLCKVYSNSLRSRYMRILGTLRIRTVLGVEEGSTLSKTI